MNKYKRVSLIIIDSAGIGGDLQGQINFDDVGANTIVNLANATGGINVPNLEKLGLGLLDDIKGVSKVINPMGIVSRIEEKSVGKDTITGHWEMMGIHIKSGFKTFTETGFPKELIDELEAQTNRKFMGNKSASGTEILVELGEKHMKSSELILYTSADSVLQIAAHEDVVPVEELYEICKIARNICMKDEWKVCRIIARPFLGNGIDGFKRTPNRHDYTIKPYEQTVLDELKKNSIKTIGIGKISDIFDAEGIVESHKTVSDTDGMNKHINLVSSGVEGFIFTNLVDFDTLYGHRRDAKGYKDCLETFDVKLGELLSVLTQDDLLILAADHGNDPTFKGTEHTRENIPFIAYSNKMKCGKVLENRKSFADIGLTVLENFMGENHSEYKIGTSIKEVL